MRLTAILLLSTFMAASAAGHSQGINLSEKNASLEKVFKEIRKQTGYSIVYTQQMLEETKPVNIKLSNATIETVLETCLKDQPLTYTIINNTIVIKPKEKSPNGAVILSGVEGQAPPPIDITGRVTDADGNPLIGATIKVKGSNKGTTTGNDGVFVLKGVDDNVTLEISFVGYTTLTVPVSGKTNVIASLKMDVRNLNEVVINKGYYTEKQKYSVSNVGKVTAKDIEKQPVQNPLLALQGRVPGLLITQSTGFAGSGVATQIQGKNNIAVFVGTDPLYVIDGVPYPSRLLYRLSRVQGSSGDNVPDQAGLGAGTGNPLSYINPLDIESIEILKDADATAIYGSRAANGAILITTKKGKAGATKVDVSLQTGWGKVANKLSVLNTPQYLEMRREAFQNDAASLDSTWDFDLTVWDQNRNTNWQKKLIGGTANYTNIQTNVSGGNINTQFLIGVNYHKETTVFPGDLNDQKGSVHFSINNISTNQKFKLLLSGSYLADNNKTMDRDITEDAVKIAPNAPDLFTSDGSLNWAQLPDGTSTWLNPLAYLKNSYSQKTNNLISDLTAVYQLLDGVELKSNFGYTNLQTDETDVFPLNAVAPDRRTITLRRSLFGNNDINSWIIEPQLNFKHNIKTGMLEALFGTTFQESNNKVQILQGSGYSSDLQLANIGSAPNLTKASGTSTYKYNALYARLNYNYNEKYIVNFNARRDGSSRFGSKNQLHNFGSIGAAWIFSSEPFLKNKISFLNFGKFRMSYGTSGNDQIGDYKYLNLYAPTNVGAPYQNTTGYLPTGLPNPYLEWEETKKIQWGLDLGLLQNKLSLNTTYFLNKSSNQLIGYNLPIMTGFQSILRNFPATVQNKGLEFAISKSDNGSKTLSWFGSFNLTIPSNKLVDFPNLASSSYATSLVIGQPTTIQKVFHLVRVDPATGLYQFMDTKGGMTSMPDTATNINQFMLINTAPKYYGGFQNDFRYRNFELDFLVQFVKQLGQDVFNTIGPYLPGGFYSGYAGSNGNQTVAILNRWQKVGAVAAVEKYNQDYSIYRQWSDANLSDITWTDASFIRLKNAQLSYTLSERIIKRAHIRDIKLYLQGQNLFTVTKYKGLDPETKSSTSLPPLRMIIIGAQIGL